ncbi:hypothetical protein [Nocardioides panacisoli]|uniref:Septum formation initiator n=1 Tax=Nocardioides panacisoli TaxID=627624 RepID=A0ABP7HX99_9ACTN
MSRPRLLAAAIAWVVVVAVGSTVVWAVISRAGDQVVSADREVRTTDDRSPRHSSTRSSRQPSPSGGPSSSTSSTTSSSTAPASPSPSTPGSDDSHPAAPPPAQRRTWQGQAGLLVAECRGTAISLVSTQPNVGFHAELKKPGPEELEVEFDGREDETGTTVTVTAHCAGGTPAFATRQETDGQDD